VKKTFFIFLILSVSLFADLKNEYPTQSFFQTKTPIIDIRTPAEWKETGIIKGAIPIMFFDEQGHYNTRAFLKALHAKVDITKPFALICRTGHRTSIVAPWLAKELHYKVINLKGGMMYVIHKLNIPTVPYKN